MAGEGEGRDVKYVLFDLETELIEGPLDLDRYVPAITVAATLTSEGALDLWYDRDEAGGATGQLLPRRGAQELVRFLEERAALGHHAVTWNGSGFDFRVLAHASDMVAECAALAWQHFDMMFWLHCQKGFSVALDRAARAVGTTKLGGLSGADAPRLWAAGEYDQVMAYVGHDVRMLGAVYEAATHARALRWINTQGRESRADGKLCPVREAYRLPMPDTSWMRRPPWSRERFVGWMLAAEGAG
jgi:hypothetical protein